MARLGDHPGYMNRPQRYWILLNIALGLGLGAYVWINHRLVELPVAVLLTVCGLLLVAAPIVLSRRLDLVRAQRDRALARASVTRRQLSDLLQNQDLRVQQAAARRVRELETQIAELHAREKLLKVQAHHDCLTGLANRTLLMDRFHFAVERVKRSGRSFALLMVDLNDFKSINDSYGHAAGDAVLVTTASRLVGAVRASDTVARLGGDEFVLIIESVDDAQELAHISRKLVSTLSSSITLATGAVVQVGASVGMAMYPDHGVDMNDLLFAADQAMYDCKSSRQMSLH